VLDAACEFSRGMLYWVICVVVAMGGIRLAVGAVVQVL
jgi:hypothetical protein